MEDWHLSAEVYLKHLELLTCNAREQLLCEMLDLAAGKGHKIVALQEVEDALPEQVGDDADVIPEVEALP